MSIKLAKNYILKYPRNYINKSCHMSMYSATDDDNDNDNDDDQINEMRK